MIHNSAADLSDRDKTSQLQETSQTERTRKISILVRHIGLQK